MPKWLGNRLIVDSVHPADPNYGIVVQGDVILYSTLEDCVGSSGIGYPDGTEADFSGYQNGGALLQNGDIVHFSAVKTKEPLDREAGIRILNEILDILTNGMTGNATARTTCGQKVTILITALERGYTK